MATLLWLAIGVLGALLSWLVPVLAVIGPLVMLALALIAVLVPREATSALAKMAIGFGGTFLVLFGPNVLNDPLAASGATYLLFGGGLVLVILGVVGVVRNRLRRERLKEAAIAQL
jgi:hypothetical protein